MRNKFNRISMTLLILSALLSVFVLPAAAQTISIDNFQIQSGGTGTVPIVATAPVGGNIAAVDITITYDPAVITVSESGVTSTAFPVLVSKINNTAGTTRIVAVNINGVTDAMTIANVQFSAVDAAGATSPVTVTVNFNGLLDAAGTALTPTITNGVATISGTS